MKYLESRLLGNILLAIIFTLICVFMYNASKKINYTWRWNNVPKYIFSIEKNTYYTKKNGTIKFENGNTYIETDGGQKELMAENVKPLKNAGSYVYVGEKVSESKTWKAGPLTLGLIMTLKISFFSIIFAILIGIVTGLMRISPIYVLKKLSITYIELVRGTPLLVQIFLLYYFFGRIFQLGQMTACVSALSIFTGAYIAEIVRAGVQSVPRGQTEAARSLGMSYLQTMLYIIMPQALKRTLPPMAGQFISLIKDSSLVSVIAITDLTKAGREVISSTLSPFEVWFTVAAMYLLLTAALSFIISKFEIYMSKAD